MPRTLQDCRSSLETLRERLEALGDRLEKIGLDGPDDTEWYQLLVRKLLPQLDADTPLIVAVVGGTNTGKSVVFNHVAGEPASASSPLASGTRHPLCLVPDGFNVGRLSTMFEGFTVIPWTHPEQTLDTTSEHLLAWKHCGSLPSNLLVLDSPDIDSDAEVNWERAEWLRRSADVLVAILTQQKYNDAAVKQFFRRAAAEDLATIVIFNQCQLPEDEDYWPTWLETFTTETGCHPEFLYLAPQDRAAAESGRLGFLSRSTTDKPRQPASDLPGSLQADLSRLHYESIKFRSLRGSLVGLLDPQAGLPAWLSEVASRCDEFRSAAELLSAEHLAAVDEWPTIPSRPLIQAIRNWWSGQRSGWSSGIHSFYNTIGDTLAWPFRRLTRGTDAESPDLLADYRQSEWDTMLAAVELVYRRLGWCHDAGGDLLSPRLAPLLAGEARQEVLAQLRTAHDNCQLEHELRQEGSLALEEFRAESPRSFRMLRRVDKLAAVARPATSIALFVVGFGPVGHAMAPAVTDAAMQTAMQSAIHVAGDVAGGTVAATLGESAISQSAATGIGYLESRFRNLQERFAVRRATWLAAQLEQLVLGDLTRDLRFASATSSSDPYDGTRLVADHLQALLRDLQTTSPDSPPSSSPETP